MIAESYQRPERSVRIFEHHPKLKIHQFRAFLTQSRLLEDRENVIDSMGAVSFATYAITGSGAHPPLR